MRKVEPFPDAVFYIRTKKAPLEVVAFDVEKQVDDGEGVAGVGVGSRWRRPFQLYFTYMYYTGLLPFKPVFNWESRSWSLEKNRVQRILSSVPWVLWLTDYVTCMHLLDLMYNIDWSSRSSKKYFNAIRMLLDYLELGLFLWLFHSSGGQALLSRLLNKVLAYKSPAPVSTRRELLTVAGVWSGLLVSIMTTSLGFSVLNYEFRGDWFRNEMMEGRMRFYSPPSATEAPLAYSAKNVVCGLIHVAMKATFGVFYYTTVVLLLLAMTITTWIGVSNFSSFVKESIETCHGQFGRRIRRRELIDAILEEFYKVKSLVDEVNAALLPLMTVVMFHFEVKIIFRFQFIMDSGAGSYMSLMLLGCSTLLFSVTVCAEMHRQICCFKSWLASRECRQLLGEGGGWYDEESWVTDVKEATSAEVGVGVKGMYTISYGFLAQVLSVTITLFIVSFET